MIRTRKVLRGETCNIPTYGYSARPFLHNDTLFFLAEGALWRTCWKQCETAYRLSDGAGVITSAAVSPLGKVIAFVGKEEGCDDLYVMPAAAGPMRRITFLAQPMRVVCFTSETEVVVACSYQSAFRGRLSLLSVSLLDGQIRLLPYGEGAFIARGDDGDIFLQRRGYGYTSWKGYQGGLASEVWRLKEKAGRIVHEQRLFPHVPYNITEPLWVKGRLYFLSDAPLGVLQGHDTATKRKVGTCAQLYSSNAQGKDVLRHTHVEDFYVRHLSTDGVRLAFQTGGRLGVYDPEKGEADILDVPTPSSAPMRARFFADPTEHVVAHALAPNGDKLCVITRGRLFMACPFKGPVRQLGVRHGVRYRLVCFVNAETVLAVCDKGQHEVCEVFHLATHTSTIWTGNWGRLLSINVAPNGQFAIATNHKHELLHIDLNNGKMQVLDQSKFGHFAGISIAPDNRHIAYSTAVSHDLHAVHLCALNDLSDSPKKGKKKGSANGTGTKQVDTKTALSWTTWTLAPSVLGDVMPTFDTKGSFLAFASSISVAEESTPQQLRLCVLDPAVPSPFMFPVSEDGDEETSEKEKSTSQKVGKKGETDNSMCVVPQNMAQRLIDFPIPETSVKGMWFVPGRLLFLREDASYKTAHNASKAPKGCTLASFDFQNLKEDVLMHDVCDVAVSQKGAWISIVTADKRLRVIKAGEKPDDEDTSFRAGGWFDWDRIKLDVLPEKEWPFILTEAWRLQKELFWDPHMGQVDWDGVYKRYASLLPRVRTPFELADVIAEMQGELGVSHAYTWGFEEGAGPDYGMGFLAASFAYDAKKQGAVIKDVWPGDMRFEKKRSPLCASGVQLKAGDVIKAVDGVPVPSAQPLEALLVHKRGCDVALDVQRKGQKKIATVCVKPLAATRPLHYAAFVQHNTDYVHLKSRKRVGYIHIPDMSEAGYQAFHKAYAHEFDREALILDVRFNAGGSIACDLLAQLMRQRFGFDQSRHEGRIPYMYGAPQGPMVALCNGHTASDGDMFAYTFQKLKLGPLIGTRTWGGVIGIFPKHPLLDGAMTSQPEYAIWFHDIGWRLENRGAEPDIHVDISPQQESVGQDPQLDRGIKEALVQIKAHQAKRQQEQGAPKTS